MEEPEADLSVPNDLSSASRQAALAAPSVAPEQLSRALPRR
jgi:hypothetical protein